jgi:CRP/FNR family transcriptional regulator
VGLLLDTLRIVDFLTGVDDDVLDEFLVAGRCVDLPKNHVIWKRGGAPEGIVIPVTGEAKTLGHGSEGREFIERFVGPGEWMGLQSSLDGLPHPADAEVTRAGAFFRIPRKQLTDLLDAHPAVRQKATTSVGLLYRQGVLDREAVVLQPVPQRLARFLLDHACLRQGDGAKVLTHATQSDIASRLGTVREVVARTLGEFAAQGLISRTPYGIFVDDWVGLSRFAGDEQPILPTTTGTTAPTVRTARFYLPLREDWSRAHEPESTGCREHLGDLTSCERNGCPAAKDLREREDREARERVAARRRRA